VPFVTLHPRSAISHARRRTRALTFVLGSVSLFVAGCSSNDTCGNAEIDTDIRVTVNDSANGDYVCGAAVVASDGTASYPCFGGDDADAAFDADLSSSICLYFCSGSGAPGKTTYTISVTAPGYAPREASGESIDNSRDSCGLTSVGGPRVNVPLVATN